MLSELGKVVIGQQEVVEQIFAAVFTRGHVLLVGVPGLAKTLLVSSIAKMLDVSFKRIQFTPDLMPSDITGTNVLEEPEAGRRSFRFVPGPLFANIVLADEINRTPPKTQAALLQAMQEREVTVGQETLHLPEPFFVIATQNPIEQEGTYPLPEAQLDRFMFDIRVGYPSLAEEEKILAATTKGEHPELKKVLSGKAIVNLQKLVTSVQITEYPVKYVARLVQRHPPRRSRDPRVRQGDGRLGRRSPSRPGPDPGRQGHGRDGRPVQRLVRRHPQGGHSRPSAPNQHQLPGPGRGPDDRGHHPPPDPDDPRAAHPQVRKTRLNPVPAPTPRCGGTWISRLPLNTRRRGTMDPANEPQWIEDGTRPRTRDAAASAGLHDSAARNP